MHLKINIATLVLDNYFYHLLLLLKITLNSFVEKKSLLLLALSAMNHIYSTYFSTNPPARACVEVSKMAKNALVEIDAIAVV